MMNQKTLWTVPSVTVLAVFLAGCGSSPTEPAGESGPESPASSATAAASPSVADWYESVPVAVWDAAAEKRVSEAAEFAATKFIANTGRYEDWWAGYQPLLTVSYAQEARFIDPARIPVTAWSALKVVNPAKNPLSASVEITGDDGLWLMRLERDKEDTSSWLVSGFSKAS